MMVETINEGSDKYKINKQEKSLCQYEDIVSKENVFLLVNLDKCYLNGEWEKTRQPYGLNKYHNHIIDWDCSYKEAEKYLSEAGFISGFGDKYDGSYGACLLTEILPEDLPKPYLSLETVKKLIKENQ